MKFCLHFTPFFLTITTQHYIILKIVKIYFKNFSLSINIFGFTDAEDYEPPKATAAVTPRVADRWEGEDEDDDVKDSWDKESDEEDDSKGSEDSVKAVQRKKKKKLQDIIAEKEAAKMKELGIKRLLL